MCILLLAVPPRLHSTCNQEPTRESSINQRIARAHGDRWAISVVGYVMHWGGWVGKRGGRGVSGLSGKSCCSPAGLLQWRWPRRRDWAITHIRQRRKFLLWVRAQLPEGGPVSMAMSMSMSEFGSEGTESPQTEPPPRQGLKLSARQSLWR